MSRPVPPQDILSPQDLLLLSEAERSEAKTWERKRAEAIGCRRLAYGWKERLTDPRRAKEDADGLICLPSMAEVEVRIEACDRQEKEAEKVLRAFVVLIESRKGRLPGSN